MCRIVQDVRILWFNLKTIVGCHRMLENSGVGLPKFHCISIKADLFTTTFSPYLLRFFTVNYALRLNLTILRLNKHRFFKIRLYRKGHTVIDHSEKHNF